VEVEARHRGWVGDTEGGADLPAGAVLGERRGGGVPLDDPAPPPAEVDEAVQDQPAGVASRRENKLHPPWDARTRRGREIALLRAGRGRVGEEAASFIL
jgi:hypothetical protein